MIKNVLSVLLITSMLLCISAAIILSFEKQSVNLQMNIDMLKQASQTLETFFEKLDTLVGNIVFGSDVQIYLRGQTSTDADEYNRAKEVKKILSFSTTLYDDLIFSLYSSGTNPIFSYHSVISDGLSYEGTRYYYQQSSWYQDYSEQDNWCLFIPHCVQDYLKPEYRKDYHTKIYRVWNVYTHEMLGYLRVDISAESIAKCFLNHYTGFTDMALLDGKGRIVFSVGENAERITKDEAWVISQEIESQGWTIYAKQDLRFLFSHVRTVFVLSLVCLLVLICFFIPYTIHFANRVVKPIDRLTKSVGRIKNGYAVQHVPVVGDDEIAELSVAFNDMSDRLNTMMDRVGVEQLLRKDAELKSLIQQVNPHFLFNTLDMIIGLTTEHREQDVTHALTILADMFRYSLNDSMEATVQDEIDQVKRYLTLINYRFDNLYQIQFEIAEDTIHLSLLRFTIQPLVENSIKHAYKVRNTNQLIRITTVKENNRLIISVRDYGEGIEESKVNQLNQFFEMEDLPAAADSDNGYHIGLKNVYARFKHIYGNELQMKVISELKKGTEIKISVPCRERIENCQSIM